jgi:GTP-binding protein EngB required for normal cell division
MAASARAGPGETQLEVDRRRVNEKISHLKAALRERRTVAATQRKGREAAFTAALVGYTNAGKSSLLNALAGTDLLAENKLFSTLDATTRRIGLDHGQEALVTDTVGFIRKLPHDLVASFRTTLDEIGEADLILHVADVTSPSLAEHLETVNEVLGEILDGPRDTLLVFNKIDALADPDAVKSLERHYPDALFVSARTGRGVDTLRAAILARLEAHVVHVELAIHADAAKVLSFCYREGRVTHQDQDDAGRPRLQVRFSDVPRRNGSCRRTVVRVEVLSRRGGRPERRERRRRPGAGPRTPSVPGPRAPTVPGPRAMMRRGLTILLLAAAVAAFVYHARLYWSWTEDDAYISFRYAQNLAHGNGLVFNPGERVEGYSNFSWVLLAAVAIHAGLDPVEVSKVLGLLSAVAALLLSWQLARRLVPRPGLTPVVAAFYLAVSPVLVQHSITGLETTFFALLLIAAVLLAIGRGGGCCGAPVWWRCCCCSRRHGQRDRCWRP